MHKRLIIHIGPHKTGTTSIQHMLYRFSRSENSSFCYPCLEANQFAHHSLAEAIYRSDASELSRLRTEIESSPTTCVLSSEEFCYLPQSALMEFKKYLGRAEVSVVYYARNFLQSLHPWWQEQVKHGSTQTFIEFTINCLAHPNSLHLLVPGVMLKNWAEIFGRDAIEIFLYDSIADVARQFASEILDFTVPSDFHTTANSSYNYIQSEMMRFWNSIGSRGSELIQHSRARELTANITAESRDYSKQFSLNYEMSGFADCERALLKDWEDRIKPSAGQRLFEKREQSFSYLHSDFWILRSELAEQLRAFVA